MSRMTKLLTAVVAVMLFVAPFSWAQTNGFADNGKGIRFGVLLPAGMNLAEDEKWILSYAQGILTNTFSKYTAMTIIDKQNIDRIIDEQIKSLSGNYSEATEVSIGHLIDSLYDLYGTIQKIPGNQYAVNFSVANKESGQRIATFQENTSLLQIHRTTVLNKASVNLMEQMGIVLSSANRQALLAGQSETVINAQSSLARGITAERSGANVEALAQYMQAAALDSSSAEINTRLSNTSQKVFTGDLKSGLQNEIQQKRAWLQILNDCAKAYDNVIPFQLEIGTLQVGKMDVVKETQGFSVTVNLVPDPTSFKLLERVLREYLNLGYENLLKYGFVVGQNKGLDGWPTGNSPSGAKTLTFHSGFRRDSNYSGRSRFKRYMEFKIVVDLVNERGKQYSGTRTLFAQFAETHPGNYERSSSGWQRHDERYRRHSDSYHFVYNVGNEKRGFVLWSSSSREGGQLGGSADLGRTTFSFNVPADDLTDTYTVKLISINGIDADTFALNNNIRISTSR